ncbi:MAG: NYN domain-containing protein [Proteobacteria bacterium]|nr:NYN domain-containing protein [Pseudomonadota bacterium]
MEDALRLAVFCDYENIAIGVREARLQSFAVQLVLERLLAKGMVLVKKAYADWDRYKGQKRELHEAGFELIEIPKTSYAGKNSADIRLVVDALDLCYTKSHVEAFAILSGDSDFSPLVSKLRENNKRVIGLGVKSSTSNLLVESCDDFIYYDDLVRRRDAPAAKPGTRGARGVDRAPRRVESSSSSKGPESEGDALAPTGTLVATPTAPAGDDDAEARRRRDEAMELLLDTVEALFQEREDSLWGSMVKQTIKRKRPNFAESGHGYRTFTQLLEDAQRRGLLEMRKDEKSGGYVIIGFGPQA